VHLETCLQLNHQHHGGICYWLDATLRVKTTYLIYQPVPMVLSRFITL